MISSQHPRRLRKKQEDAVLVGILVMKPGGQLLLDGTPCTIEVPESLSELGSCLAGLDQDAVFELIRARPQLSEMWFGTYSVVLAPSKKRNHYVVVRGCRTYLLWHTPNPSSRNPLTVLILRKLTNEEVAYFAALEAFGDPLLHLLFNRQASRSSAGKARKGHQGNLQWALNDAVNYLHVLDKPIRRFLDLSRSDLVCLGLELPYYRDNHQPEENQEKVAATPAEAEPNQGDERDTKLPPGCTQGSDFIPEEKFAATVPAGPSDMNDPEGISNKDNELKTGNVPNHTHACDTTKAEESETSTITEPPITDGTPAESEPVQSTHQESQTPVDRPAVNLVRSEPGSGQPNEGCHVS